MERRYPKAREILENAAMNNKSTVSDSTVIEISILIDIYEEIRRCTERSVPSEI